jgi:phage terminase large subunit GpA-like protein
MIIEGEQIDYSIIDGFFRGLKPDPILSLSQWAEQYRILPEVSAEPGRFRMSRTPYNKEIHDRLSATDPAQTIIFKKCSQIGATETGNNWLGYIIHLVPGPMLYAMPTDTMMKDTSKNRIQKMIDSTPEVKQKVRKTMAKASSNTIQYKEFEGGFIKMVGANSPVGLASTAVRYFYGDEIDRYPLNVSGEGSAVDLAHTRTVTFGARKKKFLSSTPTRKGISAIDNEFQKTGQRHYHVPCPHCGTLQVLDFTQLRWEKGKYEGVKYECGHCKEFISERFKKQMLQAGQWIAKFPDREDGITYGYHINALYSPPGMYTWAEMAKEFDDSEGDIPKRITFVNTKLGEVYEEEGIIPGWEMLYAQRETYQQKTVKANVAFITAGVDVQADRLEVEIVGWMKGKRSQSIDYRVIVGDTSTTAPWDQLAGLFDESFQRTDGVPMQIAIMAVDTGYNTSHVYDFCVKYMAGGRVIPIKGSDSLGMMFSPPKAVQYTSKGEKIGSIKVYNIGVSMIKSELYGWLRLIKKDDESPNGFCYFPQYDETYFRGLTAEKLEMVINKKGFTVMQWVKKYKRNEPLDCRVYARAAAAVFGIDLFKDEHWEYLVQNAGPKETQAGDQKKRKSDFWG